MQAWSDCHFGYSGIPQCVIVNKDVSKCLFAWLWGEGSYVQRDMYPAGRALRVQLLLLAIGPHLIPGTRHLWTQNLDAVHSQDRISLLKMFVETSPVCMALGGRQLRTT